MDTKAEAERQACEAWYTTPRGSMALAGIHALLDDMLSGWPRRNRCALVLDAGSAGVLEAVWQAGFDVSGQDASPYFLSNARKIMGNQADLNLAVPDHLPFNDNFFDYAIAVNSLGYWENPMAVCRELSRVACAGVLFIFPNAFSLAHLEAILWGKKYPEHLPPLRWSSLRTVRKLIRSFSGHQKTLWRSVLLGPSTTWHPTPLQQQINTTILLPLGAFTAVRIDFKPQCSGTPLLLRTAPVPSK